MSEQTKYRRYYECRGCGNRYTPISYLAKCPDCGGSLQNIGVPRE